MMTKPFRINCEGYFLQDGKILVKDSGKGFLIFPGGGIDQNETVEQGMIREVFEETGAVVKNLEKLGVVRTVWDKNWAKTEKQKLRYEQYQGDEMHFFKGDIIKFVDNSKEEDSWNKISFMTIEEAINFIKNNPLDAYREKQVVFFKSIIIYIY
jgi:8-oxo-dGTP pyrophosphatase MutT (NUDIX family)